MQSKQRGALFVIFTLSGFSGLIYESIWSHYLKLFLGHAAYAQTLVLAIFMGGMALGSWLCSKYSVRWKNLFLGYAAAEGIVGIFAFFFHAAFDGITMLSFHSVIPLLGSPAAVTVYKFTISSLLILPQSVLLGMTFPLMSSGILRCDPRDPGKTLSMLYFTNSLGAAVGVIASGYVLIRLIGLPGTIMTAGLNNVALALAVWILMRRQKDAPPVTVPPGIAVSGSPERGWLLLLLAISLLTGMASFIYEIGWIRMLSFVLGSSTHAFELMLSAFILGLAFGGLWIRRRIDRTTDPVRFLAGVQIFMGILAAATLPLYGNTFPVMQWLLRNVSRTEHGFLLFTLGSQGIALLVMFPAAFCAGMTLPLITYALLKQGYGERSIGAVYAWNTIGAILGVFFAIHLGMPFFGVKKLILSGASVDMALGVVLLWKTASRNANLFPAFATAICACILASALLFVNLDPYKMASGVYRTGMLMTPKGSDIVYYRDGKTATVSVVKLQLMNVSQMNIRTNGKSDAGLNVGPSGGCAADEPTMILLGVLPLALNPGARTAANIGFGSGLTTHTLLGWPGLARVDTIEIERSMIEGARHFGDRVHRAFTDPRSRIHIDDAKTFFSSYRMRYDIIVSEPSNPWVSGVAGLFSEEFYRLVRDRLSPGGVFCQWVQLYETNTDLVASVLKAVSANFSDYVLYTPNDTDLLILAGNASLPRPDAGVIHRGETAESLRWIGIGSIQDLEIHRVGDKKMLERFFETFPIRANSDYYPVLEQNAEKARFMGMNARHLIGFTLYPLPILDMLGGTASPDEKTNITMTPFFAPAKTAYAAIAVRDFFLSKGGSGRPIPADYEQYALQVDRMFRNCGAPPNEEIGITDFYVVAGLMSAYLNPGDLDAVWEALEAMPCARSLTRRQRIWFALFKAVGRRDAAAMEKTAKSLLLQESNIPQGPMRYLVASAMLGALAQGDREGALTLWNEYRLKLYDSGEPGLIFRLLVAECLPSQGVGFRMRGS
jgi:predicted membrane-bound spermidine synthase